MIEGWGLAAAAVVAGGSIIGSAISSSAQSGAAKTAANAETTAANEQAQTQASMANAELGIEAPTREIGGLAQRQLAYELGLSPNLDISSSFETPQVNTDGTVTWVNGSGAPNDGGTTMGNNGVTTNQGGPPIALGNGAYAPGATGLTTGPQATTPSMTSTQPSAPNTQTGGYGSLIENPFQNPANLYLSPAYQFQKQEGESVLNNQGAAAGHDPLSTGQVAGEENYVQGLASTAYQNAFANAQSEQTLDYNELAATAGEAQIGNNGANSALESGAAGISGAQGAAGSAQAAGAIGAGNALTSGIGTGLSSISSLLNNGNYTNGFGGGYAGQGGSTPGYDINGNPGNYNDAGQLITD